MTWGRAALGTFGVAAIGYGGLVLLTTVSAWQVAPWIVVPVLLHDLIVAPLIVAVVWLGSRVLPPYARTPAVFGFVVSGSMTLVALSVLGRNGASTDNPSLLNRNYLAGWLIALVVTWTFVAVVVAARRVSLKSRSDGSIPGGSGKAAA
jgi:hypothetical protein